jgi:hypothetical protein
MKNAIIDAAAEYQAEARQLRNTTLDCVATVIRDS